MVRLASQDDDRAGVSGLNGYFQQAHGRPLLEFSQL
jgi:hypothetical protein